MPSYLASVETAQGDGVGVDPADFVISHHRSGTARVKVSTPTGGHFLHAAVAMCIYNDILFLAVEQEIQIDSLRVTADGGFAGDPRYVSTGITYSIEIESPAQKQDIDQLITEVIDDASIPRSIQQGTTVQLGEVTLNPGL